jgi:hypothetical protein
MSQPADPWGRTGKVLNDPIHGAFVFSYIIIKIVLSKGTILWPEEAIHQNRSLAKFDFFDSNCAGHVEIRAGKKKKKKKKKKLHTRFADNPHHGATIFLFIFILCMCVCVIFLVCFRFAFAVVQATSR